MRKELLEKIDKINYEKIEPREILLKLKKLIKNVNELKSVYYKNVINKNTNILRISNHLLNADKAKS